MIRAEIAGAGWVTGEGVGGLTSGAPFRPSAAPFPKVRWQDFLATPNPRFGRLDDFSRAGVLAAAVALRDAGMDEWAGEKRSVGIIASTRWGCLASDQAYYETALPEQGAFASPNRFAYTLPNCFLGEAAITFGLTGPGYVINSGSFAADPGEAGEALETALDWLGRGCEAMLAGFCDAPTTPAPGPCPPWVGAGFVVLRPPGSGNDRLALRQDGLAWWVDDTRIRTWADLFSLRPVAVS